MPKYKVDLTQSVNESLTLYVQAHNPEQAEDIAQYIAESGKDPWDRHLINVDFIVDDIRHGPEVVSCDEILEDAEPCNIMPEHTEGLWAPVKD